MVSSYLLELEQGRTLYAVLFETFSVHLLNLPVFCIFEALMQERQCLQIKPLRNLYLRWELDHDTPGLQSLQSHSSGAGSCKSCCGIKGPWSPCLATQDLPCTSCVVRAGRGTVPLDGTVCRCLSVFTYSLPAVEAFLHHPLFIFQDSLQDFLL